MIMRMRVASFTRRSFRLAHECILTNAYELGCVVYVLAVLDFAQDIGATP